MKTVDRRNSGGVSADFLKLAALVTMLIDHVGAGLLERILADGYAEDPLVYQQILGLDQLLRVIGRVSFPIFCFLLVEGYIHTRSRRAYALRLFVFALLSELPFDLLFFGGWNPRSQNVFWTLLIGLLALWGADALQSRISGAPGRARVFEKAAAILVPAAAMLAAWLLKTDYSWRGVLLIVMISFLRRDRLLLVIEAPFLFLLTEFLDLMLRGSSAAYSLETTLSHLTVFLPFFLIRFYDGSRRRKGHRYFFYLFYPAHLLILFFLRQFLYILYG